MFIYKYLIILSCYVYALQIEYQPVTVLLSGHLKSLESRYYEVCFKACTLSSIWYHILRCGAILRGDSPMTMDNGYSK